MFATITLLYKRILSTNVTVFQSADRSECTYPDVLADSFHTVLDGVLAGEQLVVIRAAPAVKQQARH